jgi:predicted transcriptional regulator
MSENVLGKDTPITSYRRAVNTLMNKGLIEQSGRKSSKYDRLEYTYKLSTK